MPEVGGGGEDLSTLSSMLDMPLLEQTPVLMHIIYFHGNILASKMQWSPTNSAYSIHINSAVKQQEFHHLKVAISV